MMALPFNDLQAAPWGAALRVSRDGQVLNEQFLGYNKDGSPVDGQSEFRVASLTKQLAAYTMQVSKRDAKLADPGVAVDEVLRNASGIRDSEDYIRLSGLDWAEDCASRIDRLHAKANLVDPKFCGGFEYSNSAWNRLVRAWPSTDQAIAAFNRVMAKDLGLPGTYLAPRESDLRGNGPATVSCVGGKVTEGVAFGADCGLEGGAVSTTDDLHSWAEQVIDRGLVGAPSQYESGYQRAYAAGFFFRGWNGRTVLEHGGALPGIRCGIWIDRETKLVVTFLCSRDDVRSDDIISAALDTLDAPETSPDLGVLHFRDPKTGICFSTTSEGRITYAGKSYRLSRDGEGHFMVWCPQADIRLILNGKKVIALVNGLEVPEGIPLNDIMAQDSLNFTVDDDIDVEITDRAISFTSPVGKETWRAREDQHGRVFRPVRKEWESCHARAFRRDGQLCLRTDWATVSTSLSEGR